MKSNIVVNGVKTRAFSALGICAILLASLALPLRAQSPHLKMGNPSQATADATRKDNFLMEKEFFALSYNNSKGTPNWVSWHLTRDDLGDAPRFPFHPDQTLPGGFVKITPKDYTGSGFDRGHMCPHSDRSADNEMSEATFVMSNIIPQSPNVNEKAWARLEMYCRDLVEHEHKTLYIICGPHGKGGEGKKGKKDTIETGQAVTVPSECWKVIMVLDAGRGDDLMKVNERTRLIAVIMPNDMSVGEDWAGFRVSVKDVEKLTGYKFFDKVPDSVIEPLKEEMDEERISPIASAHH